MPATGLQEKLERLEKKITESVVKHQHDLERYCLSHTGSVDIFQWKLFSELLKQKPEIDSQELMECEEFRNIIKDRQVLEALMSSGDVENGDWLRAVDLLRTIFRLDPHAARHPVKLKLAVAVALTFAMPVISYSFREIKREIDPIKRYVSLASLYDKKPMFGMLGQLSCWHLRYVVGSWAENEELEWARNNTPLKFQTPEQIGEATHAMIRYRPSNDKGVSIHAGPAFYDYRPETLSLLHQEGGVCGVVSKFGTALCQAFGVPAMPLFQPGHCAFAWYTGEKWTLGNDCSGWGKSVFHDGIQAQWSRAAPFITLSNSAQNSELFVTSEKMRIAFNLLDVEERFKLLFSRALPTCPENYSTWEDVLQLAKNHALMAHASKNVADSKPVFVSSTQDRAQNLTENSDSEWWTGDENAWIEIDLQEACIVDHMKMQWWGYSKANHYKIYAITEDGEKTLVKTEEDQTFDEGEEDNDCNQWINISGWLLETCKVRLELSEGNKDPWNMNMLFGMRQVIVSGTKKENVTDLVRTRWREQIKMVENEEKTLQEVIPELLKTFKEFSLFDGATKESLFTGVCVEDVKKILEKFDNRNVSANKESSGAEELLETSEDALWEGKCEESWLEFDFGNICMIKRVEIEWVENREAEKVCVTIKSGSEDLKFDKLASLNQIGRKLRLDFFGKDVAVKSIKVVGVDYPNKMLFESKIKRLLKHHSFVAKKLIEAYLK